ncbi:MAG: molybdopterin converting factor [Planctomycetales bacterium]|nr:molybdopterin converting factor [Planctomycetales bacterium]
MKVLFIDATGAGFASPIEIAEGTSVGALFLERVGGDPKSYLIRVNRQSATINQLLQEGDRITITPLKIEGAAA